MGALYWRDALGDKKSTELKKINTLPFNKSYWTNLHNINKATDLTIRSYQRIKLKDYLQDLVVWSIQDVVQQH